MIDLNRPLLCYMTYPLTNNPKGNGKSAQKLALKIMKRHPKLTILIAHNSTQFMEKIGQHRSILGDISIIASADLIILGKPLDYEESAGCVWEDQIAKFHRKPVVTSDYLLGESPEPHLWRTEDRRPKN